MDIAREYERMYRGYTTTLCNCYRAPVSGTVTAEEAQAMGVDMVLRVVNPGDVPDTPAWDTFDVFHVDKLPESLMPLTHIAYMKGREDIYTHIVRMASLVRAIEAYDYGLVMQYFKAYMAVVAKMWEPGFTQVKYDGPKATHPGDAELNRRLDDGYGYLFPMEDGSYRFPHPDSFLIPETLDELLGGL